MKKAVKQYDAIRRIQDEHTRQLRGEWAVINELKSAQRKLSEQIKRLGLSWVEIIFPEPNSSGYRHTILDIHSPSEAYLFWSNGGFDYTLIISVFGDDFGEMSSNHWCSEIFYACDGFSEMKLTPKEVKELEKNHRTSHLSCCHGEKARRIHG